MEKLSYHRHRYPSIVIQQAIWLYFRFALSYRDVEDNVFNVRRRSPANHTRVSCSGYADVAPRGSRSVNRCGRARLACNFPINVTVPSLQTSAAVN